MSCYLASMSCLWHEIDYKSNSHTSIYAILNEMKIYCLRIRGDATIYKLI